ncbi:hypothetical protein C5167_035860 [Papaver somniferum]|nr:hypothetical protein C5167_035860 [Papaver somniferum]
MNRKMELAQLCRIEYSWHLLNAFIKQICKVIEESVSQEQVPLDTIIIDSDMTAKAILELIPVLNITTLIMGTKRSASSSWLRKRRMGTGNFVHKNAPDYCEVIITVSDGKEVVEKQEGDPSPLSNDGRHK